MSSFWDSNSKPIAIAHRGGAGLYSVDRYKKENTLGVFKAAIDLGYEYLELDVTSTADDKVIVLHVTTDRFEALLHKPSAPNAKKIQQLTYAELKKRLNRDIPTLGEILNTFPHTKFLVDSKTDQVLEPLAQEIIKAKAYDRVYINSFYIGRIIRLQKMLGDKVTYGAIIARYPRLFNRKLKALRRGDYTGAGLSAVVLPQRFMDEETIDFIHKQGLKAIIWTPNTPPMIKKAIAYKADGIISDNIRLLKEMLEKQGS